MSSGTDWSIGAGNVGAGYGSEYDVPKCGEGVPGCALESDGTWVHTITGTFKVGDVMACCRTPAAEGEWGEWGEWGE